MCTVFINKIELAAVDSTLRLKDITAAVLPENLTSESVQKEIHVIDKDGVVYKNAEAILQILDSQPFWRHVTWIGRLPIVRNILRFGYGIIANNRHFLFGGASRIFWLRTITVLGLASSLYLSVGLWVRVSTFPSVPALTFFPDLPVMLEGVLFGLLLGLLAVLLFVKNPRKIICAVLALMGFFIMFDQLRLQPWVYQYFCMLMVFAAYSWNWRDSVGRINTLHTLRLLVAGIYFYSGLQKITLPFFSSVFPWMVEPIAYLLPPSIKLLPAVFGFGVPFLEMAIGIGLLIPRYRARALFGVVLMLIFVLFTLGPLGHNWNSVVWPWNIAHAFIAILLFYRTEHFSIRDIFFVRNFLVHKIILLLFIVMPVFSFFGIWDSYPSYSLYSGNITKAEIEWQNQNSALHEYSAYQSSLNGTSAVLRVNNWSMGELNVPVYPEARIYLSIFHQLCHSSIPQNSTLRIITKATLLDSRKIIEYNCSN